MILTKEERKIVESIEKGSINSFYDFLYLIFFNHNMIKVRVNDNISSSMASINNEMFHLTANNIFFGLDKPLKERDTALLVIQNEFSTFISLIKTLEKLNLIYLTNTKNMFFPGIFILNEQSNKFEYRYDLLINGFIFNFKDYHIFPTPHLTSFINNDYNTDEELYNNLEISDRKKSQYITVSIAALSIIVSAFLNYLLYNNQREVHINNTAPTQIEIKSIDTNILKLLHKPDSVNSIKLK